jgi:hypothetical protein
MSPRSWKGVAGTILIAVAVAAVLVILAIGELRSIRRGRVGDEESGDTPAGVCLVLVDVSDVLTPRQLVAVRERLRELADGGLGEGETLSLYALGQFPEGHLRRLFSATVPHHRANPFLENPRMLRSAFEAEFVTPLLAAVDTANAGAGSATSPIASTINVLALELRGLPAAPKQLVLVSDLLERPNDADMNPGREDLSDLRGLSIEVWEVARARDERWLNAGHWQAWADRLQAAGASRIRFVPL